MHPLPIQIYLAPLGLPAIRTVRKELPKLNASSLPTSWNWVEKGVVTPAKDQGNCSRCWSFAVIGLIEAHWIIAGNSPVSLSEQQLIDCDERVKAPCGEEGGFDPEAALDMVVASGGWIVSSKSYPYSDGLQSETCLARKENAVAYVNDTQQMVVRSEGELAAWLKQTGPVVICEWL